MESVLPSSKCYIWDSFCEDITPLGMDGKTFYSPRAGGKYSISGTLASTQKFKSISEQDKVKLSDYILEENECGNEPTISTSNFDEIMSRPRRSLSDRKRNFLTTLYNRNQNFGEEVACFGNRNAPVLGLIDQYHMPVVKSFHDAQNDFLARTSCRNVSDRIALAAVLVEDGQIESNPPNHSIFKLTAKAYEAFESENFPKTGYPNMNSKLVEVRQELSRTFGVSEADVQHTMTLLSGVANVAAQAVQDSLFKAGTRENEFQKDMKRYLRTNPLIGAGLEDHPHSGGGVTDLSFQQIRLELKAYWDGAPMQIELEADAEQTLQYVVATGKRVGILCILDSSQMTRSVTPPENLIFTQLKNSSGVIIPIITVIVQGGLQKPSILSK